MVRHLLSLTACGLVVSCAVWALLATGWVITAPVSYIVGGAIGLAASVAFWLVEILLLSFTDLD